MMMFVPGLGRAGDRLDKHEFFFEDEGCADG